ncbi:MAG: 4-alpha-glucanotransferase [Oscillospiraceae bacterium]|nr:4-alpha-glucanotransferase [Oscillospiraceae bacterium]
MTQPHLSRSAGILLPVTALPSRWGVGAFGQAARDFIDFLAAAGQRYWQVLPLGPTGYGDSPYQCFSAFAGNPYLIDLDELAAAGLLERAEYSGLDWGDDPAAVDYGILYKNRLPVLRCAFSRFRPDKRYADFCREQGHWLEDYCLFMALKEKYNGEPWSAWPEPLRLYQSEELADAAAELAETLGFYRFIQFIFSLQWQAVRRYAAEKGIAIIGDIPIYAATDSADLWGNAKQFLTDEHHNPTLVAGVPPDYFSATGQLWGNPLYDWETMAADDFGWWRRRMARMAGLYDLIRIDHFIGIANYYAISADAKDALTGEWREGPGDALITALREAVGAAAGTTVPAGTAVPAIIAEDLGVLTEKVTALRDRHRLPGMKVLQFGFTGADNNNLPHHYRPLCFAYGGTHDNDTLAGYAAAAPPEEKQYAQHYLGAEEDKLPEAMLRAVYASVADVAVIQMQDFLGLGGAARINTPSTIGGNWQWRLLPGQITADLAERIREMGVVFGRER